MGGARPKHDSRQHHLPAQRARVLIIAFIALAGTSCTRAPDAGAPAAAPPTGTTADPQRASVLDTCSRFTVIALSSDTQLDRGPADARRRAASQFGTADLARQLAGEGRDQMWPTLVEHTAHIQVDTAPIGDDPPPLQPDHGSAGVLATLTAVGAGGWRQALPGFAVYCSLTSGGDGWKVDSVTFSDVDQSGAPG